MGFLDFFKEKQMQSKRYQRWSELGTFNATFSAFGTDIYRSDVVRSAIRPLSEHTSKANARCSDKNIEYILNVRPNMYMNGKDFLAKVRTRLELQNTAFIYILKDEKGKVVGFYPVPCNSFEALEYGTELFIKFRFNGNAAKELVLPWKELAVVRKDYNTSDIAGDSNDAILPMLELINTTNQGVANAVKATANLRGILKSTKAMLSPEDIKRQQEAFVNDYVNLENGSGIASLDSSQEFTPISMNPTVTNWETLKEFRENVYRYYGVSDAIIMSNYTEAQMESFYDSRIEPFLVALSLELTRKIFSEREQAFGAEVMYESNRLQFASTATKLNMVQLVDRGALTPNEWRMMFSLAPIEGGDEPIRRLDTATVNDSNLQKQNEADAKEDNDDNEG